jgi:hypothetical protein
MKEGSNYQSETEKRIPNELHDATHRFVVRAQTFIPGYDGAEQARKRRTMRRITTSGR